ncbi:MAG: putative zinc-binding protein [Tepidisphaerales bacterium]
MAELPNRKAGIIACSGEELAEGTVSRLAALKVLQELRPRNTVTICLPLFLAGGEGDRAFARFHPTIAVDGCELRCAARATEMYSGKPVASIVVNEIVAERGSGKPEGRRRLNATGQQAVEATAQRLAALVDEVLGLKEHAESTGTGTGIAADEEPVQAACACGSRIPIHKLLIDGQTVDVVALPLVFKQFRSAGRVPDEATLRELMETVKVYNPVPPQAEASYREAISREYAAYCKREMPQ